MPELSQESYVLMGLIAGLYFVTKLIPILSKLIKGKNDDSGSKGVSKETYRRPGFEVGVDGSGAYPAVTLGTSHDMATRGELDGLRVEIDQVRTEVTARLDNFSKKLDAHTEKNSSQMQAIVGQLGELRGELKGRTSTKGGK